jgi:ubiquinone/menaquinone biosynthesis C-methylase UbiE
MASKNQKLKNLYDRVYRKGEEHFFTFSSDYVTKEVLRSVSFTDKRVLEIGCGTGVTTLAIAKAGGKLLAIDHSSEAIARASMLNGYQNLEFRSCKFESVNE